MTDHFRANLKAYAALLGAVATALLGTYATGSTLGDVLTIVVAIATAVGTWAVPNTPATTLPPEEYDQ